MCYYSERNEENYNRTKAEREMVVVELDFYSVDMFVKCELSC